MQFSRLIFLVALGLGVFLIISIHFENLLFGTYLVSGLTLLAILWHIYLNHYKKPVSDLVFIPEVGLKSNPNSTIPAEVQMELYFTCQNRGQDIGYITRCDFDFLEFYNQNDKQTLRLTPEDLADGIYDAPPVMPMNHLLDEEGDEWRRGDITVKPGEKEDLLLVPRIWGVSKVLLNKDDFDSARVHVTFHIRDGSGEYTKGVYSESVPAEKLEPP